MIALQINAKGAFMTALLSSDTFDSFLLQEAVLKMNVTWTIDGRLNQGFYDTEVWEDRERRPYDFVRWQDIRPRLHEIVKGKRLPESFSFVLALKPQYLQPLFAQAMEPELADVVKDLILTIRYRDGQLTLLTGVSTKVFTLNKNADILWDGTARKFLKTRGLEFEELQ